MPVLNAYRPPLDAGRPTWRRVWSSPDLTSHSLMVLTLSELYLAPPTGEPREDVIAAAEGDGNLDELFGPLATVIDLSTVQKSRLELLNNSLTLDIVRNRQASRIVLTFATPEAADSCFSRIWRRLGEGCKLLSHQREWWPLAKLPLTCLALILAVTAALALVVSATSEVPAQGATSLNVPGEPVLSGPFRGLDWRWICGAGGVAAAGTQIWLWRRLTQPPVSLEVIRC